MSEKSKTKFETIDKIIIFIICFVFVCAILGTIWWVKYKANKELKDLISSYNNIQYSSYKYNIKDNTIYFYKDIDEISNYKCVNNCMIETVQSEQFIFNKDNLILIKDNNKYLIYDILKEKIILSLDDYPKVLSIKEIGTVFNDGKYGVIDINGTTISDFIFDKIDSIDNYVFTINNNILNVYDEKFKSISQKQLDISEVDDFVLLSNKDKITVIITTKNSTLSNNYKFDKSLNKFIK